MQVIHSEQTKQREVYRPSIEESRRVIGVSLLREYPDYHLWRVWHFSELDKFLNQNVRIEVADEDDLKVQLLSLVPDHIPHCARVGRIASVEIREQSSSGYWQMVYYKVVPVFQKTPLFTGNTVDQLREACLASPRVLVTNISPYSTFTREDLEEEGFSVNLNPGRYGYVVRFSPKKIRKKKYHKEFEDYEDSLRTYRREILFGCWRDRINLESVVRCLCRDFSDDNLKNPLYRGVNFLDRNLYSSFTGLEYIKDLQEMLKVRKHFLKHPEVLSPKYRDDVAQLLSFVCPLEAKFGRTGKLKDEYQQFRADGCTAQEAFKEAKEMSQVRWLCRWLRREAKRLNLNIPPMPEKPVPPTPPEGVRPLKSNLEV